MIFLLVGWNPGGVACLICGAYDLATGRARWATETPDRNYAYPIAMDGDRLIAAQPRKRSRDGGGMTLVEPYDADDVVFRAYAEPTEERDPGPGATCCGGGGLAMTWGGSLCVIAVR